MKRIIIIILILITSLANAQTGYLVQPAKWKFIRPQWLDSGMWIKNIPKYGGQNRVLVYDSITNTVGYKYISNGATYTAGRGLTLNSNTFRLDTTQSYTWQANKTTFNSAPTSTANYGLVSLGSGAFDGSTSGFFTGSANGTGLAMNMAGGYAGDLFNAQIAGVNKFKVTYNGEATFTGTSTTWIHNGNIYSSNSLFEIGSAANSVGGASNSALRFRNNYAQFYGGLQIGGYSSIVASAALQIDATTQGFLPPRMTTTQMNAISSPAEGLTVYDLTVHKLYTYDGTTWQAHW